jgi:hypothetical protein
VHGNPRKHHASRRGLHSKNIYTEGELNEISTTEDYSVVRQEGGREVCRTVKHYNLDAIIAVGYRVNSKRATSLKSSASFKTTFLNRISTGR